MEMVLLTIVIRMLSIHFPIFLLIPIQFLIDMKTPSLK